MKDTLPDGKTPTHSIKDVANGETARDGERTAAQGNAAFNDGMKPAEFDRDHKPPMDPDKSDYWGRST